MPGHENYISLYNMLKRAAERRQPREAARLARRQLRNPEKYGNVDLALQIGMTDSERNKMERDAARAGGAGGDDWMDSPGVKESNVDAGSDPDKAFKEDMKNADIDKTLSDQLQALAAMIQKQKANKRERLRRREEILKNNAFYFGDPERESKINRFLQERNRDKQRKLTDKYDLRGVRPSRRYRTIRGDF
jgi:hypothetical protein